MRGGPKVGSDAKKGGGIKGMVSNFDKWSSIFRIPGAGEQKGYDQVVTRRSGANK